ncbi:MAG TPA: LPS export ABC transporter periplasmic protein LptC [Planctomycetota bacterium]|nr:LPS export ABC transporter periplasmic protein LptC [Planctomycetota bacterium]
MRSLGLLVLFLLPQTQQQPNQLPKDPIKDFKLRRTELRRDPKTNKDVEEITFILRADEAIPVRVEKNKETFELRGVTASYFTEPERDKISKEIQVTARRGYLDNEARTLKLDDHVRVVRKNDDETPPRSDTVLTASTVLLRFNRMYECPTCRKLGTNKPQKRPGRCLEHDAALKEVTITSVEAEKDFEIMGPEGILSGEGLVTDDAITKDYHIERNGFVEYERNARIDAAADAKTPPSAAPQFAQIFSRGPLEITGPEDARIIKGHDGMRIDRIDASGTLTITSQEMTIDTFTPEAKPGLKKASPEVANVDAVGKVILEGVLFADGTSFHTTSDTLARRLDRERDRETTDLKSTGESLVHVKAGLSTIESRSVRISRGMNALGGESDFEDVARSDLVAGSQHFNLKCGKLHTVAEPDAAGRTNLRRIVATQNVELRGLMAADAKEDPGKADADVFVWDVTQQRGWLEATPLVRVTQGASTITAPKILLEASDIFVLKGPKQVHLVQERDGTKEDYFATCEGDMVLDQRSHHLTMREACVIRTKEMLVHADRVNAKLSEAGGSNQGLESLQALGHVSALRKADHTTLHGDRLAYQFKNQNLQVYGGPYAVADTGRVVSTQEQIRVYDKINPRTKQLTRYTELIGGADGVRIEMEEKASEHHSFGGKSK